MGRIAVVLCALVGCIQADLVPCDDGTLCPVGYTCSPSGCLSPRQLEACIGIVDGDRCVLGGVGGTCHDGGCIVAVCGNSIVEAGEACDDGNQMGGDGCNGSCSSDETCGNGYLELDEECDCGDAEHPGAARCAQTFNGESYCSTTCEVRRCGDGVVDPDEVCDDGNNIGGDGCSFDCASAEVCGNGVLDYFAGEQCDDSNTRSRDGCAPTCKAEPIDWRLHDQLAVPAARYAYGLAYDAARERVVMFGGYDDNGALGDTWELVGETWIKRTFVAGPSPRAGVAMVYDAARRRVVLFGGVAGAFRLDETWEYDGSTWTKRTLAVKPPKRGYASMAYDATRKRVVLFGGYDMNNTAVGDQWEYDGFTWTQISLTPSPSARYGHAMAYDPKRSVVVLYGGTMGSNQTWEYNGVAWTLSLVAGPPPRQFGAMAYDATRGCIVLGGGDATASSGIDTWEFDGTWTHRVVGTGPSRLQHSMVFDVARKRMVLFGGAVPDLADNSTLFYSGTSWAADPPPPAPGPLSGFASAYDSLRGRIVIFGGADETWAFDGITWKQFSPGKSPGARSGSAMAYDRLRDRIVLFGGNTATTSYAGDTWEFNGSNWEPASPSNAPAGRSGHAMVYDRVRQRVVLFGGISVAPTMIHYNDTWEFDGTNWVPRTITSTLPPARTRPALAYDSGRDRIVLFGGVNSNYQNVLGDTWELEGMTWIPRTTTTVPPFRQLSAMAYDETRARVVMHGGASGSTLPDLWEFDGVDWSQRFTSTVPVGRQSHALVYFAAHGELVEFGGQTDAGVVNETWILGASAITSEEACRSGTDYDFDLLTGCLDDECSSTCSTCGDAICEPLETCRNCPADCAVGTSACPITCGDFYCDSPETIATCPGDCTP